MPTTHSPDWRWMFAALTPLWLLACAPQLAPPDAAVSQPAGETATGPAAPIALAPALAPALPPPPPMKPAAPPPPAIAEATRPPPAPCPPGAMGMWSTPDAAGTQVFICRRINPPAR